MDFSAIATTVLTRVFGEYVDGLNQMVEFLPF